MVVHPEVLDGLLRILVSRKGSDLHVKVGVPPRIRVKGLLSEIGGIPPATAVLVQELVRKSIPAEMWDEFLHSKQADYAYQSHDGNRFRVNAFFQRGNISIAFRLVASSPASIEELYLPEVVSALANERRGLILVTGPTGSGKSSTLAAMVQRINETRSAHIITIEDPIETLHSDICSLINQREVGFDVTTFLDAIRAAMREDPDVILIGEMRDEETVRAAISAAETGHLVLSTLHTLNAKETVSRIIDFFPSHQHQQIRSSLAGSLRGVICQRLVRVNDSSLRPVLEVMVANGRIIQCILEPSKGSEIPVIIKEGEYYGMRTFERSLFDLIESGLISSSEAMLSATSPQDLQVMLQRSGLV